MNEIEGLVVLSSIPYLGPQKIKLLLQVFGSALNTLNADPKLIEEMRLFGPKIAKSFHTWQDNRDWKNNLNLAKKMGVEIISYTSPKYPKYLLQIKDYPILLYMLGTFEKEDDLSLAVIGTRQASIYGLEMAEKISEDIAAAGITIISGLARGIDTAAHKAALKKGRTLAVIGSGLGCIYPRENWPLAEAIAKQGAVISEFAMMCPPERQNFPRRNRIVSGIARGALLIEAPEKSGAMITMELACEQGKKLFAIPGRIDNENFKGNNLLIKQGASLIESAADIFPFFESIGFINNSKPKTYKKTLILSKEELELFDQLGAEEFSIEELAVSTKMAITKLNILLMGLMLKRAVREYPGKIYKKVGKE